MKRHDSKKKQWVKEEIVRFSHDEIDGTIEALLAYLEGMKEDAAERGFEDVRIDYEHEYEYGEECIIYRVVGSRLETDREQEKRLAIAKKRRKQKKEEKIQKALRELELYEKLKKKFETG